MKQTTTEQSQPCWSFNFVLESESGEPVPDEVAGELLDAIIDWVEERDLQIGGGFRPLRQDELEPDIVSNQATEASDEEAPHDVVKSDA